MCADLVADVFIAIESGLLSPQKAHHITTFLKGFVSSFAISQEETKVALSIFDQEFRYCGFLSRSGFPAK